MYITDTKLAKSVDLDNLVIIPKIHVWKPSATKHIVSQSHLDQLGY